MLQNVVTDDNTQATDNKASGTAVKKGMKESFARYNKSDKFE